jgi:hypothetical protein
MQTLGSDKLKLEPDTRNCLTERITSELSRCSGNYDECKYGLFAGKTCTYCLHPDHRKFLTASN